MQNLRCLNISVIDDETLESEEEFFIELSSSDDSVAFNFTRSTVSIRDNDSMFVMYHF